MFEATSGGDSRLYRLGIINCSLTDVNMLPPPLLRGLLSLDLSSNALADFQFADPLHVMPLLVQLKLSGNRLVVSVVFICPPHHLSILGHHSHVVRVACKRRNSPS